MPLFKDQPVKEAEEFLKAANINVEILHENQVEPDHQCASCHVVDQQPQAGSIVDITSKVTVQLQVAG
jgi:beta-lactam-binding protein with PASTA domain